MAVGGEATDSWPCQARHRNDVVRVHAASIREHERAPVDADGRRRAAQFDPARLEQRPDRPRRLGAEQLKRLLLGGDKQ